MVSKNERTDHSTFITARSISAQKFSLFSGFTFVAVVLLLTLLPNPSQAMVQATLFVLTAFLYLCLLNLFTEESVIHYCVRYAPPIPRSLIKRANNMISLTWILLPIILVLMFLSRNLTYLALATGLSGVFAVIMALLHTLPLQRTVKKYEARIGKTWRTRIFFDERESVLENED